jgi:hypothetical protein
MQLHMVDLNLYIYLLTVNTPIFDTILEPNFEDYIQSEYPD